MPTMELAFVEVAAETDRTSVLPATSPPAVSPPAQPLPHQPGSESRHVAERVTEESFEPHHPVEVDNSAPRPSTAARASDLPATSPPAVSSPAQPLPHQPGSESHHVPERVTEQVTEQSLQPHHPEEADNSAPGPLVAARRQGSPHSRVATEHSEAPLLDPSDLSNESFVDLSGVLGASAVPSAPTSSTPVTRTVLLDQIGMGEKEITAAHVLHSPQPMYPRIARESGWEGTVQVRVDVNPDGIPASVSLKQSSGHTVLDQAAIDAVQNWHFLPAKDGAFAVRSTFQLNVIFRLNQR